MKKKTQSIRGISLTAIAKRRSIPIQRVYNHRSYEGRTGLTDKQVEDFNNEILSLCEKDINTIEDLLDFISDDRIQYKNILFYGEHRPREWSYAKLGIFRKHIYEWMERVKEWQEETKEKLLKPKPKKD